MKTLSRKSQRAKQQTKPPTAESAVTTTTTTTLFELTAEKEELLNNYAEEIKYLVRSTLESAVRIGQILRDVRDNILGYGKWQKWVEKEFGGDIGHDTAVNFINVAKLYEDYAATHSDGLSKLSLGTLYQLGRSSVEPEVQKLVLEQAANDEPFTKQEVAVLNRTYRKAKMVEAGFQPEIINLLKDVEVVEDPKELAALQRLSKTKQQAVAELFSKGEADSTKVAIRLLKEEKEAAKEEETLTTIEVAYTGIKTKSYNYLGEIPSESINLVVVEAPMRTSYVETELSGLSVELERILTPGGYAVVTIGHKGAMFCGDKLTGLKPLHLLCLRRQPGNSRAIVGSNIISASVFAIFAYKGNYKAPKTMLVDLHTYTEDDLHNNPVEVTGLDEVDNGLERGFTRILTSLVERGDTVLHVIASNQHFNIRESLKETCENLNAEEFATV